MFLTLQADSGLRETGTRVIVTMLRLARRTIVCVPNRAGNLHKEDFFRGGRRGEGGIYIGGRGNFPKGEFTSEYRGRV